MEISIDSLITTKDISIYKALQKLDTSIYKTIFITENNILIGALSDGDIRRGLLQGLPLSTSIENIYNKNVKYIFEHETRQKGRNYCQSFGVFIVPIVNKAMQIVDFILYNEAPESKTQINLLCKVPIIIMAGGKGTRLDPITRIIPKPLIPVGNKPMITLVIEQFLSYGANHFYLTLNYLGKMIENHIRESDLIKEKPQINFQYVYEDQFLGTAGSLSIVWKNFLEGTDFEAVILSNSDILVEMDVFELYEKHMNSNDILTIITTERSYTIPYGVLHLNEERKLIYIDEKPTYKSEINTGVYFMNKKIFSYIPYGKELNMNELISILLEHGETIGVYKIDDHGYIDFGQWSEFQAGVVNLNSKLRR